MQINTVSIMHSTLGLIFAKTVSYWLEQTSRNVANERAAKWYMFVDALTINRTDGTRLRVVAPVPDIANLEEYEVVADQFMQDMNPSLNTFLEKMTS